MPQGAGWWRSSRSFFFFSSRRRHTRSKRDWSSDVCSSDLAHLQNPRFEFLFCNRNDAKDRNLIGNEIAIDQAFQRSDLLPVRDLALLPFGQVGKVGLLLDIAASDGMPVHRCNDAV